MASRLLAALLTGWMRATGIGARTLSNAAHSTAQRIGSPVNGLTISQVQEMGAVSPKPNRPPRLPSGPTLWVLCETFAGIEPNTGEIEAGRFPATTGQIREQLIRAWATDRADPVTLYLLGEIDFLRSTIRQPAATQVQRET
jgi:hypothetical protein